MANVEIYVQGIDEASSVFDNVESSAQQAFDSVEDSVGEVDDSIQDLGENSKGIFDRMADNWGKITVGAGAAALGVEGAAQSQAELTNQTEEVARATDLTSESARNLAEDMQNATFPMEEVTELMQIASQRGLESEEDIRNFAETWDMVADATGANSDQLAKASAALEGLGVSAEEPEDALDALGYIHQNTTQDVDEFLSSIERVVPDLQDMDMSLDETAGLMAALEQELGMTGRTARQELRQAINDADGDMGEMLDTLGLSEDQFKKYTDEVEGSSKVIEDNAQDVADNMTAMQKLNSWVEELTYSYGPLIQGASALVPIMSALGPAIKGVQLATQLFNTTLWASPVTWIVAGIVALIAVVWALWANWDEVSQFLSESWDWIKEKSIVVFGAIKEFLSATWEWIKETSIAVWQALSEFFSSIWGSITDLFNASVENTKATISSAWNWIKDTSSNIWNGIVDFFTSIWSGMKSTVSTVSNAINDIVSSVWSGISSTTSSVWGSITGTISDLIIGAKDTVSDIVSTIERTVSRAWNGIKDSTVDIWGAVVDTIKDSINGVIDAINSMLNRISNISIDIPSVSIPGTDISMGGGSISFPNIPNIPRLAKGGVVKDPTLAMVGDAGRGNPEIVAPQKMIAEIVGAELKKALRELIGLQPRQQDRTPQPLQIFLRFGMREFEAFVEDITRQQQRNEVELREFRG